MFLQCGDVVFDPHTALETINARIDAQESVQVIVVLLVCLLGLYSRNLKRKEGFPTPDCEVVAESVALVLDWVIAGFA